MKVFALPPTQAPPAPQWRHLSGSHCTQSSSESGSKQDLDNNNLRLINVINLIRSQPGNLSLSPNIELGCDESCQRTFTELSPPFVFSLCVSQRNQCLCPISNFTPVWLMWRCPCSVNTLHADGGIFVVLTTKEEQNRREAKTEKPISNPD